jgi:hypothetical protein
VSLYKKNIAVVQAVFESEPWNRCMRSEIECTGQSVKVSLGQVAAVSAEQVRAGLGGV